MGHLDASLPLGRLVLLYQGKVTHMSGGFRKRDKDFHGKRITTEKGDWNKIDVDGHTFMWRGHADVVVQDTNGKYMCEGPGWEVKGITECDWERNRFHREHSGVLNADDVARFIRSKIDLTACKG